MCGAGVGGTQPVNCSIPYILHSSGLSKHWFNTLRPKQNGRHFAEDICKCIFLNENVWMAVKISLKYIPKGPINNIPALIKIMAWCRSGDKPLSEPMMVGLPTHICVTRPQWVNTLRHGKYFSKHFKCNYLNENVWLSIKISLKFVSDLPIDSRSALVQVMAWCCQATGHYLNQCWSRSPTPFDITRQKWFHSWKSHLYFTGVHAALLTPVKYGCHSEGPTDTLAKPKLWTYHGLVILCGVVNHG